MNVPNEKECIPGPEMRGHLYQEVLGIPKKEKFKTIPYAVLDGEPIWLNENGTPVTCPNFPEDLNHAQMMLHELSTINSSLHAKITGCLMDNKKLFLLTPKEFAELICTTVVNNE